MKISATAPAGSAPRTPLSEARLNGPLPALPLREGQPQWQPSSPSRSPIRSLMNMVGLGKKGKHADGDSGWKGRRKGSVSPTPPRQRARALLAEDDETPIPPRYSFDNEAADLLSSHPSNEDRTDTVTMKTVSEDHTTPIRDIPIFRPEKSSDEETPILRAGPLLYLRNSSPEAWCNTRAVLQSPDLILSDPQPSSPSEPETSRNSAYRCFNLRYCSVESLPCVILDGLAASPLGLSASSPMPIGPRDIALYVFEVTFPEASPELKGRKERFATTSAWDRGKWVCHIWDAICSANAPQRFPLDTTSVPSTQSPAKDRQDEYDGDDSDTDLCTRRLQPPLRVVNVSKLSAFYDIDTVGAANGTRISSDESGRLTTETQLDPTLPNVFSRAASSTNATLDLVTPPPTAPLQRPHPFDQTQDPIRQDERQRDRAAKARSRSVPCSPSINNLGKMTLVQQRLARFESTKAAASNSPPEMDGRGRSPRPAPIRPGALPPTKPASSDIGLSTPPISPLKATMSQRGVSSTRLEASPITSRGLSVQRPREVDSSKTVPSLRSTTNKLSVAQIKPQLLEVTEHLRATSQSEGDADSKSPGRLDQPNLPRDRYGETRSMDDSARDSLDTRRQSTVTMSTARAEHLSGLTSIPGSEYPDIAPLFSLVRDTALEQAAHVKALTEELEALRIEMRQGPVEPIVVEQSEKEMTFRAIGRGDKSRNDTKMTSTLDLMREQLSSITAEMKNLAAAQGSEGSMELNAEIREALPRHSQQLTDMRDRLLKLDSINTTLAAMNEASCADRASWTQRLAGVAGSIEAIELDGVHDRLDGIRASLAVLEAVAQSQQPQPTSISPISAFRDASRGSAANANASVDLAPVHEKLDALANKQAGPADEVLNGLRDQVKSLSEICTKIMEVSKNQSLKSVEDAPPGGEKPQVRLLGNKVNRGKTVIEILTPSQDLQISRALEGGSNRPGEVLYRHVGNSLCISSELTPCPDLNGWLQANATQTSSQYHTISTALQQLTQALGPLAFDVGSSDSPSMPGPDGESHQTKGNILHEIRSALLENNARNRGNDNFLAAANHLIGAANAERQNLTALIASQREENEKLLNQFANQITVEIRGQKHSFVDAMEKATALNVEGQLRELKTQISSQLVEMAKGVERLSEERKVLEQQIAELLAFKSRFTPPDYSDMPSVSPGEYMPQVVPRSSRQQLRPEPTGQSQQPRQPEQHGLGHSRSPSPAPGSRRPLPSPNQLHPMHHQAPQLGQRF
ncbi:hypothetical protein FRB90_011150 [Tulasnella sp. 427]|nr:hypothetical protein FRB90_011150 [Tulasnella sp. 427]